MIPVVISFFLGILTLHFFRELPTLRDIGLILLIYSIFVLIFLIWKTRFRKLNKLFFAFILGFLWVLLHAKYVIEHWAPSSIEGKPIEVIGVIHQIPLQQEEIMRFELDIKTTIPKTLWPHPGRVKLRWVFPTDHLQVGDEWQFFVRLKRPHAYSNPGSFDYERQLFQNHIVAEGGVVDTLPYHKLASSPFSHPIDRIRSWFKDEIQRSLEGLAFAGIINALVVGVREGISFEQSQIFKNTGTAHLIAISGLHVGLMASFTFMLVGFIWRLAPLSFIKVPVQWLAAAVSILAAFLYAILAGFSVSTQRAVVMVIVFMVGILYRRRTSAWRNYFLALWIVLILDPLSTLSSGFWLSFGAVGILLYGMKGRLRPKGVWWRWGRAQWVVFLGLAPLTLTIFSMVSIVSPIANVIAIPWVSLLVVPFSLIGAFSLPLNSHFGGFFLKIAEYLMRIIWPFLEWTSQFPKAVWMSGTQTMATAILSFIGVLLLLAPRGFPGKYIGIILILPIFLIKPLGVAKNQALVTVLDVGQGLATVIETANHVLVFDTGPKLSPRFDTGEQVVLPFLKARGRKSIDALVISHADNDHMGGANSILRSIEVKKILTSDPKVFPKRNAINCYAGQWWEWDGVRFEMLHPDGVFSKKRNDYSCVLRVRTHAQSVLLTADIEAKSEQRLVEKMAKKLKATVMLVPHHGSKTSSTLEFIQAVNPLYAIIPVGYRNAYGHPKSEIVARYQKAGIKLLNTVHDGAISFVLNNEEVFSFPHPHCYRLENKRYWHLITDADGA